jgi:hypothetical protein
MQIAVRRAFLTQDHRLALVWRLLSYVVLLIVVNLLANVVRVVLEGVGVPSVIGRLVFTLLYITGSGTRCRLGLERSHLNSGSFVYTDHYQRSEGGEDVIA